MSSMVKFCVQRLYSGVEKVHFNELVLGFKQVYKAAAFPIVSHRKCNLFLSLH